MATNRGGRLRLWRKVQIENLDGIVAQEMGPDMVPECNVWKFAEHSLDRETRREIAGIHDFVHAARVGVVDNRLRKISWSERACHVIQARPFQHQFDSEIFPRFCAVTHHDS